ncbi:MAG: LamG domain-containing protein, partial [Phycisphaerales bacterium]
MYKKPAYFTALMIALIVAYNATAGLVGHWTFDEGSGTVVADSSGKGNDGTVMGGAAWVAGQMGGGALNFDDSDDIVIIPYDPSLDVEDALTISLWVNTPEVVNPNHMVTKQPSGTAPDNYPGTYEFRIKGNTIQFLHQTSQGTDYSEYHSTTQITAGEWHHAVVSIVEGGLVEFYLDGVSAGSLPQLGAFGVLNDDSLRIGGRKDNHFFNGILDDVYIYARALTLDQIVGLGEGIEPTFRKAENPSIPDNTLFENTWANLTWTPGDAAVSHNLYFGTGFDDVNDGAEGTFVANLAVPSQVIGFPTFPAPDGLQPGTTYYWRVDEVNDAEPNSPWKGGVWSFSIPPRTAYNSSPGDGATNVLQDVTLNWAAGMNASLHQVYFGDNLDDVTNAAGAALQSEATHTPATLEAGKTYYWRVDEFDNTGATHKGSVWSFTTVPDVAVANPNLMLWWTLDEGADTTAVDWSGHGNHGAIAGGSQWTDGYQGTALTFGDNVYVEAAGYDSVTGTAARTCCAWIRTTTANRNIMSWGQNVAGRKWIMRINDTRGLRVEVSGGYHYGVTNIADGQWHHVAVTFQDDGTPDVLDTLLFVDGQLDATGASLDEPIDTATGPVRIGESPWHNRPFLDEIDDARIYDKALTVEEIQQIMLGDTKLAGNPEPQRHATVDIRKTTSLSWSAGSTSVSHDVYFGTDRDAVAGADNNAQEFQGNQAGTSLSVAGLIQFGGGDYYWRIDEVEADGTVIAGTIWKFTVPDYLIVDNFESYDNIDPAPGEPGLNRIFDKWIDGYGNPLTNGAIVGNPMPPYAEQIIVHSGSQSMNYSYDNAGKTSEATLTLT